MKIGVLTLPLHNNFGGILQAYALQRSLEKLGHSAILIDKSRYVSLGPWYKKYLIYIKRGINRYIFGKDIIVKADVEQNRVPKAIAKYIEPFIEKNIKVWYYILNLCIIIQI